MTGQYTRTFSLGTLNSMDVLYYPPPLASGNIPHPCNSRYLGKIFLYIDHNHMEYLYIIYFIYFFSIKQLRTTEQLVDYLFSSELEIPRKT